MSSRSAKEPGPARGRVKLQGLRDEGRIIVTARRDGGWHECYVLVDQGRHSDGRKIRQRKGDLRDLQADYHSDWKETKLLETPSTVKNKKDGTKRTLMGKFLMARGTATVSSKHENEKNENSRGLPKLRAPLGLAVE